MKSTPCAFHFGVFYLKSTLGYCYMKGTIQSFLFVLHCFVRNENPQRTLSEYRQSYKITAELFAVCCIDTSATVNSNTTWEAQPSERLQYRGNKNLPPLSPFQTLNKTRLIWKFSYILLALYGFSQLEYAGEENTTSLESLHKKKERQWAPKYFWKHIFSFHRKTSLLYSVLQDFFFFRKERVITR